MVSYKIEVISTFFVQAEDEFEALKKVIEIIGEQGMDIGLGKIEKRDAK